LGQDRFRAMSAADTLRETSNGVAVEQPKCFAFMGLRRRSLRSRRFRELSCECTPQAYAASGCRAQGRIARQRPYRVPATTPVLSRTTSHRAACASVPSPRAGDVESKPTRGNQIHSAATCSIRSTWRRRDRQVRYRVFRQKRRLPLWRCRERRPVRRILEGGGFGRTTVARCARRLHVRPAEKLPARDCRRSKAAMLSAVTQRRGFDPSPTQAPAQDECPLWNRCMRESTLGDCPNFRVSENGTVPFSAGPAPVSTKIETGPALEIR